MGVKCPECGKEVANERALAGHLYGVHGRRIGLRADVEKAKEDAEKALTLAIQHTERLDHFLKEVDERLGRLERMLSEIKWRKMDGCLILNEDRHKDWAALLATCPHMKRKG